MSEGKHLQALNTIGIERQVDDSDIAVEVKAVSLKAAKQPKLAIEHFDEMFKRLPNALVAYELAELNLQTENFAAATTHADYGIANSKDDMVKAFYETQTPYQVPLKAAFLYIKGLIKFNENTTANIDAAVDILDEALKSAPNFNMAQVAKNALLQQKQQQAQVAEPTKE
jgi:tetratricopeptide (TPR) repeat protein